VNQSQLVHRFQGNSIFVLNHYSGCSFQCRYTPCGPQVTAKVTKEQLSSVLESDLLAVPAEEAIWIGAQVDPDQHIEKELGDFCTLSKNFQSTKGTKKHKEKAKKFSVPSWAFGDGLSLSGSGSEAKRLRPA
jgi:hypothetical protein